MTVGMCEQHGDFSPAHSGCPQCAAAEPLPEDELLAAGQLANIWKAMWHAAESESDRLEEALKLILPLAKGYVAKNRVGSNEKYIEIADAMLAARSGNDG